MAASVWKAFTIGRVKGGNFLQRQTSPGKPQQHVQVTNNSWGFGIFFPVGMVS